MPGRNKKKLLDEFFKAEQKVQKYFGYREDWKKIPIVDQRRYNWMLVQQPDGRGVVLHHELLLTPELLASGSHYSNSIYTQRFLPKWVYRTKDFTMVCEDTHVDGNQWLGIYDNAKEVRPTPALLEASKQWLTFHGIEAAG